MAETTSRVRLVFEGAEHGVVAAAAKSVAALKALGDENTKVGKTFESVDKQATKFIGAVTKTAAVTSLVSAGGGLIGQAFAGALPIMTALGVASGTVALGMDGIKKAASGAQKPFEDLKKAVSGTFEKDLKGPVQDVAGLLPKLTSGFQGVAASISGAVGQLTGFAASARGVAVLRDVLGATAGFIDGLGPQLTAFVTGVLSAMASAKNEMRGLGDAFGSIFGSIGNALRTLANDDAGTFAKAIAGLSATLRGLGAVIGSVVDVAIRLGAAFGDSFGVLLNGLADGISKASPGLVDLGSALGDLFRAIAPLLPTIGELAGSFAHSLADGIRAVLPYVTQFADWARNNVGTIKTIAEGMLALALAVKALNIFTSVVGWVEGAVGAFGRLSGSADSAATKTGLLKDKLGLLKGLAIAGGLLAAAEAMDQINIKAAGGTQNLQGFKENLHDIAGAASELLSGDFGKIGSEFASQMAETKRNIQSGQSLFGEFLGFIKRSLAEKLPPLNFDLNTGPATGQLNAFMAGINRNTVTVNINGRTVDAAQSVAELMQRVKDDPNAVINFNGQTMKVQDALKFVIGLINNSNPEVQINGQAVKAGDALAGFVAKAQGTTATAQLNANGKPAYETVGGWTRLAEGTTGVATLDADKKPADGKTGEWVGGVSRTRGVATLDANPATGNAQVAGWKGRADGTVGTARLNADGRPATVTTATWQGDANRSTGTAHLNAEDSGARGTLGGLLRDWGSRVLTWTVHILGGAAAGGPIFSGAVHGPGTGTSDTAGLFRLSNGEHVLTAREVQLMGGQGGVLAFRRSLAGGNIPRMTATRGRAATGGGVTAAGALEIPAPTVNVAVHVDGNEVRSIVRTEIDRSSRSTRRTVTAGAGTSY